MRSERKGILMGLAVTMLLGIAVYFRLWTIDYAMSADDTELLRRQFDLANREAMDESAEWRMKYDVEVERAAKCDRELAEQVPRRLTSAPLICSIQLCRGEKVVGLEVMIKQSCKEKVENARMNQKVAKLQKENMALIDKVEALKRELEAAKLKCHS